MNAAEVELFAIFCNDFAGVFPVVSEYIFRFAIHTFSSAALVLPFGDAE